jgi:hypothetical protein
MAFVPPSDMHSRSAVRTLLVMCGLLVSAAPARAQDNYEIQVYGADTVEPGKTMVEFHNNFTVNGSKTTQNGVYPTNHDFHETLEITRGFNSWFETGWYTFTSIGPGYGWQYVGTHLRPRVRVPEKWHWPVGVSLSTEFGYQRRAFSEDTWTLELRPIVDQKIGRWYWSFNPTFEKSLAGLNQNKGFDFSPNFKLSYDVTKKVSAGFEYYGGLGPVGNFDPLSQQQQQLFPAIDLNLSPKWEINFGLGVGLTASTDHLIVKTIIGYRFDRFPWPRR